MSLEQTYGERIRTHVTEKIGEFGPDVCGEPCEGVSDNAALSHRVYVEAERMIEEDKVREGR